MSSNSNIINIKDDDAESNAIIPPPPLSLSSPPSASAAPTQSPTSNPSDDPSVKELVKSPPAAPSATTTVPTPPPAKKSKREGEEQQQQQEDSEMAGTVFQFQLRQTPRNIQQKMNFPELCRKFRTLQGSVSCCGAVYSHYCFSILVTMIEVISLVLLHCSSTTMVQEKGIL